MEKLLVKRVEAAELLSVSVKTLDRLSEAGKLSKVNIGTRVYYSPDELRAFITKEGALC